MKPIKSIWNGRQNDNNATGSAGARRKGRVTSHQSRVTGSMANSLKEHPRGQIAQLERRLFLRQGLRLGAPGLLSGWSITAGESGPRMLWAMARWNDRVQAWIFDPNRLAPEFPESRITMPFPFNAFYSMNEVPRVDAASYKLELWGLIRDKKPWTLPELYALEPQVSQITRHICVEGWSAIGKWSGVRFS